MASEIKRAPRILRPASLPRKYVLPQQYSDAFPYREGWAVWCGGRQVGWYKDKARAIQSTKDKRK